METSFQVDFPISNLSYMKVPSKHEGNTPGIARNPADWQAIVTRVDNTSGRAGRSEKHVSETKSTMALLELILD